jgi:hypothetical protein
MKPSREEEDEEEVAKDINANLIMYKDDHIRMYSLVLYMHT